MASKIIDSRTVAAIDRLLSLFTQEEKDVLKLVEGGVEVPLVNQFVARGWGQIPVCENLLVFEAKAARIKSVNKGWFHLLNILKQRNFFLDLLDPNNYKETISKNTVVKSVDKRQIDQDSDSITLARTLSRTAGGTTGTNRSYAFSQEWDEVDRKRLDSMAIEKEDNPLISTETGEEDDTRKTDEAEARTEFIKKIERLDNTSARRLKASKAHLSFGKANAGVPERELDIFDASVSQSMNATAGDSYGSSNTFVEGLKRQAYLTSRDRIVLAEAINKIANVDFMDVHERIFEKLDVLFKYDRSSCQL